MLKRYFILSFLACTFTYCQPYKANAQWLWMDLNFDGYDGTAASLPQGIYASWNSVSPASYYSSAGNFGISAPSYKFGNDGDQITMFNLPVIDSISFWMKGNGSPFSPQNELRFYLSPDSITFNLFLTLDSLPSSGTNISIPFNQAGGFLKIEYGKAPSGGNLAFDDFKLYSSIIIGVNETVNEIPISVYPTPTTGLVNIRTDPKTDFPEMELYDVIGNKIPLGAIENKAPGYYSMDISDRNRGFYFLKIRSGYQFETIRITLVD